MNRRVEPRDDLISRIVHATEEGERLSDAQLIALVRLLIIAGIETTANLIASLVRMLLADRSLWEAVQTDRSLVPNAVEEALRLDPPLNWTPRLAEAASRYDVQIQALRRTSLLQPDHRKTVLKNHRALVAGIRSGNPDRAEAAMRTLMREAREAMLLLAATRKRSRA